MTGIEVNVTEMMEEILRTDTGHMTEVEAGIEIIKDDLVGLEKAVNLGKQVDSPIGIKVKREGDITVKKQTFYKKCYKNKRDPGKKGAKKHKYNK